MSTTLITFEYNTVDTLTTSSSILKADDLVPISVVKKAGSIWNVSYSLKSVMETSSRINALYKIFCSYPQDTTNNLTTFLQLRLDFCIQTESYPDLYCPNNIEDFNNLNTTTCSRLISKNQDFNNIQLSNKIQCYGLKQYLDINSTDETMKTLVQQGYKNLCENNPTMKECQCYNRANFEAYKNAIKILSTDSSSMQSGNESCWYSPCIYKTNIQVDPDLQLAYGRVQCPNVCQNIIALVNNQNVSLSDISLSNDCIASNTDSIKENITDNITNKEATKIYTAEETKSKTTTPSPTSKTSITIDQKTLLIIIGSSVGVMVVIFVINLIFSGKPNQLVDKK